MRAERIRHLARRERLAGHVGFWWGLAEGSFFFIVPDVYISFAALFSLRAGATAWLLSILGSLVAIPVIYLLSVVLGVDYLGFLDAIPGISPALIERVSDTIAADGLPYTGLLVLGGVPLKVYAGVAFFLGMALGPVMVWTAFARIVRIAPTFAMVAVVRVIFRRRIDARPKLWTATLLVLWLAFYVFYFTAMSRA